MAGSEDQSEPAKPGNSYIGDGIAAREVELVQSRTALGQGQQGHVRDFVACVAAAEERNYSGVMQSKLTE